MPAITLTRPDSFYPIIMFFYFGQPLRSCIFVIPLTELACLQVVRLPSIYVSLPWKCPKGHDLSAPPKFDPTLLHTSASTYSYVSPSPNVFQIVAYKLAFQVDLTCLPNFSSDMVSALCLCWLTQARAHLGMHLRSLAHPSPNTSYHHTVSHPTSPIGHTLVTLLQLVACRDGQAFSKY